MVQNWLKNFKYFYFLILNSLEGFVLLVTLLLQKVFLCKIYKAYKFHNL